MTTPGPDKPHNTGGEEDRAMYKEVIEFQAKLRAQPGDSERYGLKDGANFPVKMTRLISGIRSSLIVSLHSPKLANAGVKTRFSIINGLTAV